MAKNYAQYCDRSVGGRRRWNWPDWSRWDGERFVLLGQPQFAEYNRSMRQNKREAIKCENHMAMSEEGIYDWWLS